MIKKLKDISINRNLKFWLIQLIIWSTFFIYYIFFNQTKALSNSILLWRFIVYIYFGMLLTGIQRHLLNKYLSNWDSGYLLIIYLFVSSFLLSNIWFLYAFFSRELLVSKGIEVIEYDFNIYLQNLLTGFVIIFSWSSLYLSYKYWENWKTNQELQHLKKELDNQKLETELKLLKTQINPNLLFDILDEIYNYSLSKSSKTPSLVLRLSELMSYVIYDCREAKVPLRKELDFLTNYIELEKQRYKENIKLNIETDMNENIFIPPLLLMPIVESAFGNGTVEEITLKASNINNVLFFIMSATNNDIDEVIIEVKNKKKLSSLIKRLELIYPQRHKLVETRQINRYTVKLEIDNPNNIIELAG